MLSLQLTDQTASTLMGLPNELLLNILKEFLDLGDLWRLLQVSRAIRSFAMHTIHRRWKIELSPEATMKVQCRAALIALEALSCQLSGQTSRVTTPFAYPSSSAAAPSNPALITAPAASSVSASSSAMTDLLVDGEHSHLLRHHLHHHIRHRRQHNHHPFSSTNAANNNLLRLHHHAEDIDIDDDNEGLTQRLLLLDQNEEEEEEEEDEDEDEDGLVEVTPHDNIVGHKNSNNNNDKMFYNLMRREERLHQRIILGISSYKHKYVLIEDIDIRNRIRSAVDVVFHHGVFVEAVSRSPIRMACTHTSSSNRAQAAMMVRLLTRLDSAFPACCREITFTLADNIKAFLEYTGYKLLAIQDKAKDISPEQLYAMVFGPACQSCMSFHLQPRALPTTTTAQNHHSNHYHPQSGQLLVTLHTISACFDIMGAAFIGKILNENHIECAVQRTCELLSDPYLRPVKRALLVELLEGWLTIKRGLVASELCRWVRIEIERCDQQEQRQQHRPSLPPLSNVLT